MAPLNHFLAVLTTSMLSMRLIPVLDVLNHVAVRGIGGRREEYRPLVTQLCAGSNPLDVAAAYRHRLNTARLYLADLDAIVHHRPNIDLYRTLLMQGTELWLDAGVRSPEDVESLEALEIPTIIIGLESWDTPASLRTVTATVAPERLLFSLDLRRGQPCGGSHWPTDPIQIVDVVLKCGLSRFLVLDLHDVGQHTGGSTVELCHAIRARAPHAEIITGGGIRNEDDVHRWEQQPIDGLLIASAIHDGRVMSATRE